MRRILTIVGLVIVVLAVILAGAGTWPVRRPWPEVKGSPAISGLTAPVEILRDKWGVPHIYAENEHDLIFAQGYVHAQDRLWQMEFNRHIGSGTLSAILGDSTLDIDRFMRTLGLRRAAERDWALLEEDVRLVMQAYADGVNAYVDSHRGRLPVEFSILGVDPAPWAPIDSLTWGKAMAFDLGGNYYYELLRARIIAGLGAKAAQMLLPPYDAGAPVIVPAGTGTYTWLKGIDGGTPSAVTALLGHSGSDAGSNSGRGRLDSLAVDPQHGPERPAFPPSPGRYGARVAGDRVPPAPLWARGCRGEC